jgi:hypothetical protein
MFEPKDFKSFSAKKKEVDQPIVNGQTHESKDYNAQQIIIMLSLLEVGNTIDGIIIANKLLKQYGQKSQTMQFGR